MFALQIGSWRQLATCNVLLDDDVTDGQVLLQYTRNKVSLLIASANEVRFTSRFVYRFIVCLEIADKVTDVFLWSPLRSNGQTIMFYSCGFLLLLLLFRRLFSAVADWMSTTLPQDDVALVRI